MKPSIKALAAAVCLVFSASAPANPISDAFESLIRWGAGAIHEVEVRTGMASSPAASSEAASTPAPQAAPNPFEAKSSASPLDPKLKALHDKAMVLARENESLYAAGKPFPEFFRLYRGNIESFNTKACSLVKASELTSSSEFPAFEDELHANGLDWISYARDRERLEVIPDYAFLARLPGLQPEWQGYFAIMEKGYNRVSETNRNKALPSPEETSEILKASDAFLRKYPEFPYAYEVKSVYFSLLHFYLHDSRIERNAALRGNYESSWDQFLKEAPNSVAAPFVKRNAARIRSGNFALPKGEVREMEQALGLEPARYVPVSRRAQAQARSSAPAK